MATLSDSVVLRAPPPDEELKQAIAKILLDYVLPEAGFFFHYERCTQREPGVIVHTWWEPLHPKIDVRLVCDDVMSTRYVQVSGPDPEVRRRLLDHIAPHLAVVPLDELRHAVRQGGDEGAWLRLALGSREFDLESFDLIKQGMVSPDATTRRGAAQAAVLLEWPQLGDVVLEVLGRETDPLVRPTLDFAAKVFRPPSA